MATVSDVSAKEQTHKVVVYGATGYTGQLTCEFLTKLGVPFTASGRNQAKLDDMVKALRKQGAECNAKAAEHTQAGLCELMQGAAVMINISGPFAALGPTVVQAALASGCHYIDSTGEQDFMLDIRKKFGESYRRKNLVLSPSNAFLWGIGIVAADLCLQTPGINDLEVAYAPPSLQTMASLQSVWRESIRDQFSIANGQLSLEPFAVVKKTLPDGITRKALCTGTGEPTFLLDDKRVISCRGYFASNLLANVSPIFRFWKLLNVLFSYETLDRWSDALIERFKRNPQREEPESGRFVVSAVGKGPGGTVQVAMNGTSPYMTTGYLLAASAQALLQGRQISSGYVSIAQAFGSEYVLKRLEEIGTYATVTKNLTASPASAH